MSGEYEAVVELPDGETIIFRGDDPAIVAAQAARIPAIAEEKKLER